MYSEFFFYRNELVLYENAKNCFTRKMNEIEVFIKSTYAVQ